MLYFIKETRYLLLIFALAFTPYLLHGGIIYDDWSVIGLSLMPHFSQVYLADFPAFSNRPLAPIYYYFISRFEMQFWGYILTDLLIWGSAIMLYYRIIARNISPAVAAIFVLFAMLPFAAATTIFSPGMQSIGAVSCLLMAVSLRCLEKYLDDGRKRFYYAAYGALFILFFTYEIAFPLLTFQIMLPYLRQKDFTHSLRNLAAYVRTFVLPVLLVLLAAVLYQKYIILHFWPDISRIRMAGSDRLAQFSIFSVHNLWDAYTQRVPQLAWQAVDHIQYLSKTAFWLWILQCALAAAFLIQPKPPALRLPRYRALALLVLALFFNGVVFLIVANTGADITEYANRSFIGLYIIYAFYIALLLGLYYPLGRIAAAALYVLCALSFTVERENYIHSAHLAQVIPQDALAQLTPHMAGMTEKPTILGDVPEHLHENYNGETIISDEVTDWNMTLGLYSHDHVAGVPLTPRKVHEHKVEIKNDRLIVDHGLYNQALVNLWYYRYRQGDAHGTLRPVKDKDDLLHLIDQIAASAD